MVIHLFTFHFFRRVIVCVHYGINYAQKQRLGGKKQHGFVAYSVTHRMRPSKKKKIVKDTWKIVYLNSGAPSRRRVTHAVTHLSSDVA